MTSKMNDGLTRDQRHRLKNLDEYRRKKREYARTPEQRAKRTAYMKIWRSKNKERSNEIARNTYQKNKHKHLQRNRDWHLKTKYGITQEIYDNLLLKQDYRCFICNVKHEDMSKGLHIDHDHNNGEIRGLLCSNCNGSLGWYEKYNDKIRFYLEKHD